MSTNRRNGWLGMRADGKNEVDGDESFERRFDVYLKNNEIPSNVAMRGRKSEPVEFDGENFTSNRGIITGRRTRFERSFQENLALVNDCLYANSIDDDGSSSASSRTRGKISLHAWSLKINADTSLGPNVEFRAEKGHMVEIIIVVIEVAIVVVPNIIAL